MNARRQRVLGPLLPLFCLLLVACQSKTKSPSHPAVSPVASGQTSPPAESIATPVTELSRADVVRVVDAGLGRFLQDIELKAVLKEGRFVGFQIVQLKNTERFRGVGLAPGDIVTLINGRSIEREGEAFDVFRSLKSAAYLEVDYYRSGEKMRLSLPIVGEVVTDAGTGGSPATSQKGPS